MKNHQRKLFFVLTAFVLALPACAVQDMATPLPTAIQNTLPSNPSVVIATFTPAPSGLYIGDSVPTALREQIMNLDIRKDANVRLDVSAFVHSDSGLSQMQISWIYALVAPFSTVTDGVTFDELHLAWTEGMAPAPFSGIPLLMSESTLAAFTTLWDAPAAGSVRIVSEDQLLDVAWSMPNSWAIIPFESLEPRWKALTVDDQSPIRKDFDLSKYSLVVGFTLETPNNIDSSSFIPHPSNYDPSKLTTVILTGVTALVRATALTMEYKGVTYPGEKIRNLLREADIAHVSNEIPFFTGCKFPKPNQGALVFCSDPKYIDLLTDIGTDVVELTGNHFADYGPKAMLETLEIYKSSGIPYFGGGADLQDSLEPVLFESNGNRIAFIGCNRPDVERFPTARDFRPGAAPCDFEYLTHQIGELKLQGYVIIATFQWNESYSSDPSPQQRDEFRMMADAGASIVSGSQAHFAQAMELYNGSFIHYGLGNLFFDQMGDQDWMPPGIRREFFDRYVIYDGRLLNVELITALLEDYSRPRLMTERERTEFLQEYFYYSGWTQQLTPTLTPTVTPTLTPMSVPFIVGTPRP
jgi:poly-gamma-glutamate synthesis protein (capsule biosynthesis protein)